MVEWSNFKLHFNGATDSTGYGSVGHDFINQLFYNAGIENICVETDWRSSWNVHSDEFTQLMTRFRATQFEKPDLVYNLWNPICSKMYDIGVPHVLETVFETNIIQKNWVDICNQYDQTWLPSEFAYNAFVDSGVVNCKMLPYGFTFWDTKEVIPIIARDTRYKFLFINQWSERKNAYQTVEAFCKTFTAKDNVVLYIRSFVLGGIGLTNDYIKEQVRSIKAKYPDSPQIILLDFFRDDKLPKLYNSVDCLLSPSSGEGVGKTIVEAMSQKLPVITTNWSAMSEYCTDKNSLLLNYELVPVNVPPNVAKMYYFEEPGMEWASPNFDEFCEYMQALVDEPALGVKLGTQAAIDVRKQFDWKPLLDARLSAFEEAMGYYE
ncbi:glycosyltransferase family 4 protein [Bacteroides sp.]|uniref:glycosyltransferase family 4 protein n=1 Tax=Bacteroides sp. TaxID=29523 RepID=UPI002631C4E6|nr:glycosyltransferase [Bacteroides sp.]MDD3039568.1 glycosyltransferase [Bacteroides sp.]